MTDIELEQLAEETRNEINKVAFLCSGEEECHTFDVGFITGYKKASHDVLSNLLLKEIAKEIDSPHNILPPSKLPKPLTCLEYALTFWNKNRDFKIYYNADHCITLKEGTIPPEGYLDLKEYGLNHLIDSFYDRGKLLGFHLYIHLLGLYFMENMFKEKAVITVEDGVFQYTMPLDKKERETPEEILKGIDFSKFNKH